MIMSIYEKMKEVCKPDEIAHHESDLYVPVTVKTTLVVNSYDFKCNVTTFKDQITGRLYYDIPFEYQPYWDAKLKQA